MGHRHSDDESHEHEAWDAGMIHILATSESGGFWDWVTIIQTTEAGLAAERVAIGALSTKS